jgi:diguanylate cyclase (GGDEF)-like protein
MEHAFATTDRSGRPPLRVLVLAWAAFAAQTPAAAAVWALCLAFGVVSTRRAAARFPRFSMTALPPAPAEPPSRRRTAATPTRPRASTPGTPVVLAKHRDAQGGLPSLQDLLDIDLDLAWAQALHARRTPVCVLRVGLSGLDTFRERYGHQAGNHLLSQTVRRLRVLAQGEDRAVMRIGASEFLLMLPSPQADGSAFARQAGARVVAEVQRPMTYRTLSSLHIGCHVGAALWMSPDLPLSEALAQSQEMLALAQASGRGQARLYAVEATPAPVQPV